MSPARLRKPCICPSVDTTSGMKIGALFGRSPLFTSSAAVIVNGLYLEVLKFAMESTEWLRPEVVRGRRGWVLFECLECALRAGPLAPGVALRQWVYRCHVDP